MNTDHLCEFPRCESKEKARLWKSGPWFAYYCPEHFEQEETKRLIQHRHVLRTRTRSR